LLALPVLAQMPVLLLNFCNYSAYKTVSVSICHKFSINFPNFRPATEDTIIISSSSVADFAFDIGSRYQPT